VYNPGGCTIGRQAIGPKDTICVVPHMILIQENFTYIKEKKITVGAYAWVCVGILLPGVTCEELLRSCYFIATKTDWSVYAGKSCDFYKNKK
jgi:hypothetical protein